MLKAIVATYTSGDRDNHANGLRIAVCNLMADEARRQGFKVERFLEGSDSDTVRYAVRALCYSEFLSVLHGCAERGLPRTMLELFSEPVPGFPPIEPAPCPEPPPKP